MNAEDFAKTAMQIVLAHEADYLKDYAKPMATFVVRFSGEKLAHVGKAVDAALDRILAMAKQPVAFRGMVTNGAKWTRYAKPRKADASGRKLLTAALATQKVLPKRATQVYFSDGKAESLVPADFAAYVGLAKDARETFATGKGFLAVAFPMAQLTEPRWTALVDELVVLLSAELAFMGPAVWMAPQSLFNGALNDFEGAKGSLELWGTFPQIEMPSQLASRSPFRFEEYEPDALAGFLAPAWRMWLGAPLAKKVKRYGGETAKLHGGATRYHTTDDPFTMTEATYAAWKDRWAELAPVHVTNPSTSAVATYYRDRFAAKTLAALKADWTSAHDAAHAKQQREFAISRELQKLAEKPTPKLLTYAESIAKEMTSSHAWYFLPALRELLAVGKAKPEEATVWLDLAEQMHDNQILPKAAAVAAVAGEHDRAIDLLRRAIEAGQADPKHVAKDPDYKPIRKHPQYAKLVRA